MREINEVTFVVFTKLPGRLFGKIQSASVVTSSIRLTLTLSRKWDLAPQGQHHPCSGETAIKCTVVGGTLPSPPEMRLDTPAWLHCFPFAGRRSPPVLTRPPSAVRRDRLAFPFCPPYRIPALPTSTAARALTSFVIATSYHPPGPGGDSVTVPDALPQLLERIRPRSTSAGRATAGRLRSPLHCVPMMRTSAQQYH